MQKILITGSNGLIGQELISLLSKDVHFEVFGISKGKNRIEKTKNFTYFNIDITDKSKVIEILEKVQPDFIIHAAAITNVDLCETNTELCDAINITATSYFVNYCKENTCYFIYISTDFVFDGKKESFYVENDTPNPINYYGLSKLKSEKHIQKNLINYTILRTILVFGKVENPNRSNIVLWVKNSLENNKPISVITDQYRMPTFSKSIAEACLLSIKKQVKGIFHISGNELLSIYDIALQIAEVFELNTKLITPILTIQLNQKAKRPEKTGFNLKKSIIELGYKPKSFKEELKLFKIEFSHKKNVK